MIVFRISQSPNALMTDMELLKCVGGITHGFEIVHSIFPGWRFSGVDTTAACALHGCLMLGQWHDLDATEQDEGQGANLLEELAGLEVELYRNDSLVDCGRGSDVLGSPLKALRHLVQLLDADEWNEKLKAGEVVTTGTLTRAWPISKGEKWWTILRGLEGVKGAGISFM